MVVEGRFALSPDDFRTSLARRVSSTGVSERLARQAQRAGLAPRTLAQRYVDESLRREDHPLIRFADGPSGRLVPVAGDGRTPSVWPTRSRS
jgi:hypothetical protein